MSQCLKIQQRLEQTPNHFVSMPDLVRVSGSYNIHSRISDLRERGLDIENKVERVNGQNHSYYKLIVNDKQLELI